MPFSIYDISVPALVRGLGILSGYIDIAATDAATRDIDPAVFIGARLAPDMIPFSAQIQRASDTAKGAIPRLTGIEAPSFPDTETTFDALKTRLANTIGFLNGVPLASFENSAQRPVEMRFRTSGVTLSGADFVTKFLLPNFYFHITTAHAILRHNGVKLGKLDYIGPLQ